MSETEQPNSKTDAPEKASSFQRFWSELKRRHVMRVAGVYAVVAWLIIQIAVATFEGFGIPDWAFRFVVIMVILGFPIALIIAWAFELTPQGIKATRSFSDSASNGAQPVAFNRKGKWMAYGMGALLPTLIFGSLATYFYFQSDKSEAKEAASLKQSIAVLPLQNLSPDAENAFFADGVQEDILTNLSKIDELLVISRSSTLRYREREKSLKEIGADLDVRYLVEGSVRRAANRVLVTVQLIDVETDAHLWAENFDRSLDDIFAIQAEIAKTIAGQLKAVLSPEEVAEIDYRPTKNQEAYDYYMKARLLIEESPGRGDEKIELLSRAVGLDRDFAEAWAQLAVESIYWWKVDRNRNDPVLFALSEAAMSKAERLAPESAQTYYAKGVFARDRDGDYAASEAAFKKAIAIQPTWAYAKINLAFAFKGEGRFAAAQDLFESVLETNPLDPPSIQSLPRILYFQGNWDDARAVIEERMQASGGDAPWTWDALAELDFYQSGDVEELKAFIKSNAQAIEDPGLAFRKALLDRDLEAALSYLKTVDPEWGVSYFGNESIEPYFERASLLSALISVELGNAEEALLLFEKAKISLNKEQERSLFVEPRLLSSLAVCYAFENRRSEMDMAISESRRLARASQQRFNREMYCEMQIAIAYLVAGDNEKAIETLEAASEQDWWFIFKRQIPLWFVFDELRGNPRFDKLLAN